MPAPEAAPIAPDDQNLARDMFAQMAFVRAFEAKALALSQTVPPAINGSLHFCAGQEAVPVGALAALRADDQLVSTYRGHGWALAAGLDPLAVMAELCHRSTGINGGRGGSAYLMAPWTRFIGENSIVGAGTTIAAGAALANQVSGNGRIVVVTIGDGAMNQGAVHEALAFASVRKLPVIFVIENNGWSELTATGDMFMIDRLAQRARGYGIPCATVVGSDPITVRDNIAAAAAHCRGGGGPTLLEFVVPRLWGHYNRDIEHYRPKADRAQAEERDPLRVFGARLVATGLMAEPEIGQVLAQEAARVDGLADAALSAPPPSADHATSHVIAHGAAAAPEVVERKEMKYIEAVNAALRAELAEDPRTLVFGEDVGKAGGIFAAARNLQREFGAERVFDTPIAENAILGSAVGAALGGMKPIVEIMWADFIFVALDQLVNQAANIRYITGGQSSVPLVVRTQQGATPGSCAQHSQSIEAILAHVPGLKVALAASAHDAYTLLRAAAADPDPCIVIEARSLYQTKGEVEITRAPEAAGKARLRRRGRDVAIVTWGTMVEPSLAAAEALQQEGVDAAVLDLRWLNPLDEDALLRAVAEAGGRALVVHEAVRTGGFGAEVAMRILERCPTASAATVARLATADVRMPAAPELQASLLPNADSIGTPARRLYKPAQRPADVDA